MNKKDTKNKDPRFFLSSRFFMKILGMSKKLIFFSFCLYYFFYILFIPNGLTYLSPFRGGGGGLAAPLGGAYVSLGSQVTVCCCGDCGARGLENDLAGAWYRAVWPKKSGVRRPSFPPDCDEDE